MTKNGGRIWPYLTGRTLWWTPGGGTGAFLNAIPMRGDMRMETWAMRISVQRRLGLPLDVACQAVSVGKKTRNKKTHDEFGDAAVNVPDIRQIRAFLVLRYISPVVTSRLAVRPWMVRRSSASSVENHPTPVTGSERAQPQEVPNRANSARLAAPLA